MLQHYNSLSILQKEPTLNRDALLSWSTVPAWRSLLGLVFFLFTSLSVYAQTHRTCATIEVNKANKAGRVGAESTEAFEQWLDGKIQQSKNTPQRTEATGIYTIPVVVHIIHNGEAVGTGTNISDSQVESQIRILNEDYRRKSGTRGYNTNPVGADTEIEFRLALTDPEGFPTKGILRVKGSKQTWTQEEDATLKSLSYWPSEQYLNIWVCNLGTNTLGYAQFPESDQVSGVSALGEEEAMLDGVVIGYKYFGDEGAVLVSGNDFRYGRTTTHEVGHFLGLRHIWGDAPIAASGCYVDDYCSDTPNAREANYDCPASDSTTCTSPKQREMVENYMDYTDDACMSIFTAEQKLRMRTVLENSPRRASLLTSPGLEVVRLIADNARIVGLTDPEPYLCENTFAPVIVLRNYGNNPLHAVKFVYQVTSGDTLSYNWTGNLATTQIDTVTLPSLQALPGEYAFSIRILSSNGNADADTTMNTVEVPLKVLIPQELPFWANFDKNFLPGDWQVLSENNAVGWTDIPVPTTSNTSNKAAYLNYYQSRNTDTQDVLLTAAYDLSTVTEAYLVFDVSYARRGLSQDGLAVSVSTDCGNSFSRENTLYQKTGSSLATTTATSSQAWSPMQENHWRVETINLSRYIGQKAVRFAFTGTNDGGNNLYLDNVRVVFRKETIEEEVNGYRNLSQALQIFPNPNSGKFNILFNVYEPKNVEVRIFNLIGQQVMYQSINGAQDVYEMDLTALPAGMYLVNASSGKEEVTKKVVIFH
ncbi:M43 family zinc metalloprotease [Rhodocytophaga aerolata]|uniref:M43 family zinc metalloprotease n=1 Tax=Rhodocytophaga aerolata TaxID=455078 RepID=A0ABT8REL6_9BACT|nr:T9SS type A sorting domain-containing protein [Rhodocytophaga aerolata]MDO1450558.1 M43 family zinc metalloprotease [Rhodocytophaga aerolata]